MNASRRMRCTRLFCAIFFLALCPFITVNAQTLSATREWAVIDNSIPWGGWLGDPQEAIDVWAEAHNFGALPTGAAPISFICIRNARPSGTFPYFLLAFEFTNWTGTACGSSWVNGSASFSSRAAPDWQPFVDTKPGEDAVNGMSCPKASVGDPINPATGNVYKIEQDVPASGGLLEFTRFYNSDTSSKTSLGKGWRHSFSASISAVRSGSLHKKHWPSATTSSGYNDEESACVSGFGELKTNAQANGQAHQWLNVTATYSGGACRLSGGAGGGQSLGLLPIYYPSFPSPDQARPIVEYAVTRDDGRVVRFPVVNGAITNPIGSSLRLQQITGGFELREVDNSVESYDLAGRLQSIRTRTGVVYSLAYDALFRLSTVTDSFGRQLSLAYGGNFQLASVTDSAGHVVQYSYDSAKRLSSVTNADSTSRVFLYENSTYPYALTGVTDEIGNRQATWTYDSEGRGIGIQEAGGTNAVSLVYNPDGSVTTADALGAVRVFTFGRVGDFSLSTGIAGSHAPGCGVGAAMSYDEAGFPSSNTDYNGNVTHFTHDGTRGLETSRTEAFGSAHARTVNTTWHASFRVPTQIVEPNRTTSFTHDAHGNPLTRTIADTLMPGTPPRTWTYTYDSYGRVLTEDGPRSDVSDITTYTYYTCSSGGACGHLHTITNAAGQVTTFATYNASGDPLTIVAANNSITTLIYDARRRVTSISANGETSTIEYWPIGLVRKTRAHDGAFVLYGYDAAHRLTSIEDGEGNKIVYTLDAMGNRTAENVYDPSGALAGTRSGVFNSLSQLWKDVPSAGTSAVTTAFAYDGNGNVTQVAAPLARNSTSTYDELNRLKQITDPANGVTALAYDDNDNLMTVTDPRNLTTSYNYNGLGDLLEQTSPDTGTTINTYDEAGNRHTSTDARGMTGTNSYDALNRLTSIAYPDQTLNFSYDNGINGAGRLTGASSADHTMAWSYDALGRVVGMTQIVGSVARSVGYGYQNGNLVSLITPSGQTISYGYANGRIASVSVNNVMVLNDVLYEPFGGPRLWAWANGTSSVRTQDLDGKVTQLDSGGEFNAFDYDEASRITGIENSTEVAHSWAYGYDAVDRLTTATNSARSERWTYDANGNRLGEAGTASAVPFSTTYTVSGTANRLNAITGSRANTYSFDADGNTTAETNARRPVVIGTTATVSYAYNALSQRIWKSGPDGPTYFVYDQSGHLLGEYGAGGALIQETVWLDDVPVATLRPNSGGGVDTFYVHTDHLGAPRKVSRPIDNVLVWRWDSTAFGTDIPNENPQSVGTFRYNLRFPGQYYDAESGLHYNYFRTYDPGVGGYTQSDPIGLAGGINTYSYALSNPISFYDPYGLWVPPSIPDPFYNFLVGGADGLSFGIGPLARNALGMDAGVDRCSTAYKAGDYASLAAGVGRAAYAGAAKALPFIVRAGETELANALAVSAGRNTLKRIFRIGTLPNYKMYTSEQILQRYGPNAPAIIDAATRTSPAWNALGIDAAVGGAVNASECECK